MTSNQGRDLSIALAPSWFDPGWFRMSQHMTRDRELSTEAVGAAARMVDNDEDFRFNATFLQNKLGWGRDKVRRVLGELEAHGYLAKHNVRADDGRYTGEVVYLLYPKPPGQDRETENTSSGDARTPENPSSGADQAEQGVSAGQTERLKTRAWFSAPNKDLNQTKIQSKPRAVTADGPRMDGSMDQHNAPKDLLRSILEAHDVPRPQWPVNGLYSTAIAETRRLLDAGVSADDITSYVASRGSLTGPNVGAASPVLVARLKEMPAIAAAPKPAPKPKPCIGGCVDGRLLCSADCPPDMSKGVPMPCTGRHEPRGGLCRVCAPRKTPNQH